MRTSTTATTVFLLVSLVGACATPSGEGEGVGDNGLPPAGTAGTGPAIPNGTAGTVVAPPPVATAGIGGAGGTGAVPTPVAGSGGVGGALPPDDTLTGGDDTGEPLPPTPGLFPPVSDFTATGPYTSTTLVNVGPANNYTVYMPMEPPPDGAGNPVVAWTSGGGTSHVFYTLLPLLASHGFVVISSNTIPGIGAETTLGDEIIAGLDWALAEHARAGSELEGRLDTTKIASAGYSMGSLATFTIAADPRFTTTVHISGGNMAPERVNNLHAPAAFICGVANPSCTNLLDGTCDIAGANCAMDFENATTPVFYATFESGHLGILTSPFMERINGMTHAWLRHYLMGDTTIATKFDGSSCEYCTDPNWTVQQKNF